MTSLNSFEWLLRHCPKKHKYFKYLCSDNTSFCTLRTHSVKLRTFGTAVHQCGANRCSLYIINRECRESSSLPSSHSLYSCFDINRRLYSENSDLKTKEPHTKDEALPLIVQLMLKKLQNEKTHMNERQDVEKSKTLSMKELESDLKDLEWDFKALQKKAERGIYSMSSETQEEGEQQMQSHGAHHFLEERNLHESLNAMNNDERYKYIETIALDEFHKKRHDEESDPVLHGTPDESVPVSQVPCPGCGSKHHCRNPSVPGYMPSERFKSLTMKELCVTLCQRCYLLVYHKFCLQMKVSTDEYLKIMSDVRKKHALVLLLLDLTDFQNSVIKDLMSVIGTDKPLHIIGNKIDLIPQGPHGYLKQIKTQLREECERVGLNPCGNNIMDVSLISAKTGYGVEYLISALIKTWENQGDVYLVGCTNAGKSTLFNALLRSDYCKSDARNLIHRATVSKWPGTTLSLLKFPIITPLRWRLKMREERLNKQRKAKKNQQEAEKIKDTLFDYIGMTDFRSQKSKEQELKQVTGEDLCQFELTHSGFEEAVLTRDILKQKNLEVVDDSRYRDSKFLFDTPGAINQEQIVTLLTQEELFNALPTEMMKPRPYLVKPTEVVFITGLGRLDYIQGEEPIYFTVFTANNLPVYVLPNKEADIFYEENIGKESLLIPSGGEERLNKLPALVGREFKMCGSGWQKVAADIQLSSLGWVSVSAEQGIDLTIRAYTPGCRGCYLRDPPLFRTFGADVRKKIK